MPNRQPRLYETKRKTYVVTWPETRAGKIVRARREYSDGEKAREHFREVSRRFPVVGAAGLAMDAKDRADFFAAKQVLPKGVSVSDAARFFVAKSSSNAGLDIDDALEEWLEHSGRTDKSLRTAKDRRNRVRKFIEDAEIQLASDITVEAVEKWLWRGVGSQTIIQEASFLRAFCRWLVKRKRALEANPLDQIEIPAADDPDPQTLTAGEVSRLLEAARKRPSGKRAGLMVPFFAIAIFAGLRPSEILRLGPESMKLDAEKPFIRVRKLKRGRGVRLVPVSETLKAWLAAYPPTFPVAFTVRTFRRVRIDAGLKDNWQGDVLRHTCISAWLGIGRNEDEVAAWAGNSPKMIHRHYRDLLTREESLAILGVYPLSV